MSLSQSEREKGKISFGVIATSATTEVAVRKTAYTEQYSNAQRSIVSSSVLDTSAGTGARTVKLTYLTSTFTGPFTETITLNGVTAVNTTATDICYIEKMEILTAGSLLITQGTISLKSTVAGGGVPIGSISAGDSQTFWAHHYIPTGITTNILSVASSNDKSSIDAGAVFNLKSTDLSLANATERQIIDSLKYFAQDSTYIRKYPYPIIVVGPARIVAYVIPDNGTNMNSRIPVLFNPIMISKLTL